MFLCKILSKKLKLMLILPTHIFKTFVNRPLSPRASEIAKFACINSILFRVTMKFIKNIAHGTAITNGHNTSLGT